MSEKKLIKPDFYWIGALDPELRVFDIVMETKFGTTYNSYLLKGSEKIAVFETVKDKFFDDYIEKVKELTAPATIDYIIVNHTEPDHAGSIAKLLDFAPSATVVGTTAAIKYLSNIVNKPFPYLVVKHGDTLSLGNKTLQFIMAPSLHWPDTMYSYIQEDKTVITCDSFGAHYCHPAILKSALTEQEEEDYIQAYTYYYEMIMGPFKPFILQALTKIKNLDIDMICPGHGMILEESDIPFYKDLYEKWSTPVKRSVPSIVIPYVSAYGYTKKLAEEIAKGIASTEKGIEVLLYNMEAANKEEVLHEISLCSGLLIGSPTILCDVLPPIWELLVALNPVIYKGIKAGCFGSYGWSGEAIKNMEERLKQLRFTMPLEPLRVILNPSEEEANTAFEFGVSFANEL